MSVLPNEKKVIIRFNKKFSKPPVVTLGGSHGTPTSGSGEGFNVTDVTTESFTYWSHWAQGEIFTLHWIAISL